MKKIYLHPLPLRIWHWANACIIIFLIVTGIQLRVSGMAAVRPHDPALILHKYMGWGMTASFIFWLAYSLMSRTLGRNYTIGVRDLRGISRQIKYYLITIFQGEENPFRPASEKKFNPLQKLAYGSIMGIFAPVLVITGLLFSDILFFRKYILLWDIAGLVNALHVAGAYVFILYLVVHLYMATLGRSVFSHARAMIVGYEEEPDESEENAVQEGEEVQRDGASAES
jgi:thiosulfate reductase cytochrome b subunit